MATTEEPRARSDSTAEWKRELYDATPEREGELFTTISGQPTLLFSNTRNGTILQAGPGDVVPN